MDKLYLCTACAAHSRTWHIAGSSALVPQSQVRGAAWSHFPDEQLFSEASAQGCPRDDGSLELRRCLNNNGPQALPEAELLM